MRLLISIILLIYSGCLPKNSPRKVAKLPDGVYSLKSECGGGCITLLTADSVPRFLDTIPLLTAADFSYIIIYSPYKQATFELNFSGRGHTRFEYLKATHAAAGQNQAAIVLDGKIIGFGKISPDTGMEVYKHSFGQMNLLTDLVDTRKLTDSLNAQWKNFQLPGKSFGDTVRTFYDNGKLYTETIRRDSLHPQHLEFFENGNLSYESGYRTENVNGVMTDQYTLHYTPHGLAWGEYFFEGQFALARSYYPDGKVKTELFDYQSPANEACHIREYDPAGALLSEEITRLIGPYKGEFDNPQIYHEKNYRSGMLLSEGEIYSGCGECDRDSCGTWFFYRDGKVARKKQFPSWQVLEKYGDSPPAVLH